MQAAICGRQLIKFLWGDGCMFLTGNTLYLKYGVHSSVTVYYMHMGIVDKMERWELFHVEALVDRMT